MKRPLPFLCVCWMILGVSSPLLGQGISYQAVARDAGGVLIANQTVNVSFLIREGADNGPVIYDESHSPTTNGFALFSVVIGEGNVTTGDFSTIDWAATDHFLQVEINGASVGVTKFNAVPYSKVATNMELGNLVDVDTGSPASGQVLKFDGTNWVPATDEEGQSPWQTSGNDIYYSGGRVGIGTAPTVGLHVEIPGQDNDILVVDDNAFVRLDVTGSSGNSGIAFYNQGSYSGWISHRGTSDALVLSGAASSIAQPHLVIAASGRIGIGTFTPSYPLHLTKDTMSINGLEIANLGSANLGLDGDIVPYGGSGLAYDIGNNTATEHWDDVVASDFITYSDARVKENIEGLRVGLNEIMALRPVQYRYTRDFDVSEKLRFGLIAQEVEPILPSIVIQEDVDVNPETGEVERKPTELKTMTYMELVPVLIQAVQEQQAYIESLEARLEALESQAKK